MTEAALVFDDGPGAGMGHRRRMSALASALEELGVRARMVASDGGPVDAEVVVVDSYRWRVDEPGRFAGRVVAAIDDLARDLACDVVVDPNPGAPLEIHHAARRALVGPKYALVDPSLAGMTARAIANEVTTALVASGASDLEGVGSRMAAELARLLPGVQVRLAVGPWSNSEVPEGVVGVRTDSGLEPALADADIVVTAAGVTLVEALALGRPAVAVVLADNQRRAARGVDAAGAALVAGVADAPEVAASLARDAARRRSLAVTARAMVDGHGAQRVASALLEASG
ncbi:MAG: glycosyltransferase [Acidimicrobiales bacterium]